MSKKGYVAGINEAIAVCQERLDFLRANERRWFNGGSGQANYSDQIDVVAEIIEDLTKLLRDA